MAFNVYVQTSRGLVIHAKPHKSVKIDYRKKGNLNPELNKEK